MDSKLKALNMFVHVEKREDFLTMLEICEANGFEWDEGMSDKKPTTHFNAWDVFKTKTIVNICDGIMCICYSIAEYKFRTPLYTFELFIKCINEVLHSLNLEVKPLVPDKKLLNTVEDISIVATVLEDIAKLLSSHVLQMKRQFTNINSVQVAKYACTAQEVIARLGINIEVFVHEEQKCIIYRFKKA